MVERKRSKDRPRKRWCEKELEWASLDTTNLSAAENALKNRELWTQVQAETADVEELAIECSSEKSFLKQKFLQRNEEKSDH